MSGSRWHITESRLRELGVGFRCVPTCNTDHLQQIVSELVASGANAFVSVGGDGAVNLLVDALLRHSWHPPPKIGLLPFGTGCDFARSFKIPRDPVAATSLLGDTSATQLCDVGVASGCWGKRHFVNVASIGVTAAAVRRASRMRWLGAFRYLFAFWTVLPTFQRLEFEIKSVDGSNLHQGLLAVVANGRFFGGGFEVCPDADILDGKLDVMMVASTRWQIPKIFQLLRTGSHMNSPNLICSQSSKLKIVCNAPAPVELDGEYVGSTPIDINILPGAIRVATGDTTGSRR